MDSAGCYVAVKVLPAYFAHDPTFSLPFKRERRVKNCRHGGTCAVHARLDQDEVGVGNRRRERIASGLNVQPIDERAPRLELRRGKRRGGGGGIKDGFVRGGRWWRQPRQGGG